MSLVYFGVSLPNQLEHPLKDKIRYCSPDELARTKISHDEYESFLNALQEISYLNEVIVLSTCNRFEVVFDIDEDKITNDVLFELSSKIRYETKSDLTLAYLLGNEAKFQLARTYCGLNSALVGESEITIQLDTAFRQGLRMGYLGEKVGRFYDELQVLRKVLDDQIYKNRISYCDIALKGSFNKFGLAPESISKLQNILVLGSGNTAYKSCTSLVANGVQAENITLVHRVSCSSVQLDSVRAERELAGINMTRSKDGYYTSKVQKLAQAADMVVFGIDSKRSVLDLDESFMSQRTKFIDFNSNPSVTINSGFESSHYISNLELDSFVRIHSYEQARDYHFMSQARAAERFLENAIYEKLIDGKSLVSV